MVKTKYCIMHKDHLVATLSSFGECRIISASFMPYSLYLEEDTDLDALVNNMVNFYAWCAGRVVTLDRKYVKEILSSIGAAQARTDKERAQIALSYHCLSLTDVYWVKKESEELTFSDINLYDNHLSNTFVDISLRGKRMTATNYELAPDLSTNGMFPKAWVRREDGFWLYKDGEKAAVENELLASRVARCFDCPQVLYEAAEYEGQKVSVSHIFTDKDYSICNWEAFQVYAINHDVDQKKFLRQLDEKNFAMMNIIDYLVGNTDRHWGNWGLLIDNRTNKPVSLHPLMDFNQAFQMYDTVDGANCLTVIPEQMTQRQAAAEAVRKVGIHQIKNVEEEWFAGREEDWRMFQRRLSFLKALCGS